MNFTASIILVLCAVITGVWIGYHLRGSAQDQFIELPLQQRVDFIYAMSTPEIRRAIAEDWCAINRKTRGICGRARLVEPIHATRR